MGIMKILTHAACPLSRPLMVHSPGRPSHGRVQIPAGESWGLKQTTILENLAETHHEDINMTQFIKSIQADSKKYLDNLIRHLSCLFCYFQHSIISILIFYNREQVVLALRVLTVPESAVRILPVFGGPGVEVVAIKEL